MNNELRISAYASSNKANKGAVLNSLGNYTEAIKSYDKALAIDPHNVYALNNKGAALYRLGNYPGAILYYHKALAIQPNYVNALINKGISLHDLGHYHDAIISYDKVLALKPNDIEAIINKANAEACMNGKIANTCHTGEASVQKPARPFEPNLSIGMPLYFSVPIYPETIYPKVNTTSP